MYKSITKDIIPSLRDSHSNTRWDEIFYFAVQEDENFGEVIVNVQGSLADQYNTNKKFHYRSLPFK